MKKGKGLSPWIFPVIGLVIGIVVPWMHLHGLFTGWQFIGGPPSEKINQIIGMGSGDDDPISANRLYLETISGDHYSVEYLNYLNGNKNIPTPIEWRKEENQDYIIHPAEAPHWDFYAWPLLVRVKQTYVTSMPEIEGQWVVKFVLEKNGNLWMWNDGIGSYEGFYYFFCPPIGAIIGGVIALMSKRILKRE
ncbi:MAG: hypothetical protein WA116_07280 [Anaerolineaceae bacterium]